MDFSGERWWTWTPSKRARIEGKIMALTHALSHTHKTRHLPFQLYISSLTYWGIIRFEVEMERGKAWPSWWWVCASHWDVLRRDTRRFFEWPKQNTARYNSWLASQKGVHFHMGTRTQRISGFVIFDLNQICFSPANFRLKRGEWDWLLLLTQFPNQITSSFRLSLFSEDAKAKTLWFPDKTDFALRDYVKRKEIESWRSSRHYDKYTQLHARDLIHIGESTFLFIELEGERKERERLRWWPAIGGHLIYSLSPSLSSHHRHHVKRLRSSRSLNVKCLPSLYNILWREWDYGWTDRNSYTWRQVRRERESREIVIQQRSLFPPQWNIYHLRERRGERCSASLNKDAVSLKEKTGFYRGYSLSGIHR